MFFGQPNTWVHLPPLVLLYPLCIFLLALGAKNTRDCLFRCFLLGLAANSATLYWLVHPMHDVAALPYPAAAACVVLLSCYLAIFTAMTGFGMRGVFRLFALMRRDTEFGTILLSLCAALLCGLVYGGFEVAVGWLFTGFPWLSLSSAFAFWPSWVQSACIFGSYGLSAVFAFVACLGATAFLAPTPRWKLAAATLAVLIGVAVLLYGHSHLSAFSPETGEPELTVLMVQGNVDQNQKWNPAFQKGTLDLYLELSRLGLEDQKKAGHPTPVLVLWPETALPFYFQIHREYSATIYRFLLHNNINLMFGTLGIGDEGEGRNRLYNRVYLLSPHGGISGWYDKRHLVPFGEYIPFAADIPYLRNLLQGVDFSAGSAKPPLQLLFPGRERDPLADAPIPPMINGRPQSFTHGDPEPEKTLPLGVLICYEAIFPYLAQQEVAAGARVLVNVSNDAWFRNSSAPLQHLSLTAMRAVEQSRSIVRSTNTGITAVIDPRGRIQAHTEHMFEKAYFSGTVPASREITLFHRFFPIQEYVLVIMAVLSLLCHYLINFGTFRRDPHVSAQ